MSEAKRFFRTIVRFEVLSSDAPFDGSLERLAQEVMTGSMSGRFLEPEVTELTREAVQTALLEQGSDADFLDPSHGDEDDEDAPAVAAAA
jgi:hypothetical protein